MSHSHNRVTLFFLGTALSTGTAIQAVTGLAVQIILMRMLFPEDFGRFAMILAGCSLTQTLLSLRLNILIIRLSDDEIRSKKAQTYQAALFWETILSAALALIWLLWTDLLSVHASILLAALTIAQWVNQAVSFYERGMAYGRIVAVETGSQIAGHSIALTLVLLGFGPISLYLRELVAAVVKLVAFAIIGALPQPVWSWPGYKAMLEVLREARGAWAEGILEGVFSRLIILMSGSLAGLHAAGLFAQSYRLAILPHQFLSPITSRLSVNLFSRNATLQGRKRLMMRLGLATLTMMLTGCAVTWLWAPDIVPWLMGDKWLEAGLVLRAMIGVIMFMTLFDLIRSFCYAQKWVLPVLIGRIGHIGIFTIAATILAGNQIESLAFALSFSYTVGFVLIALFTGIKLSRIVD